MVLVVTAADRPRFAAELAAMHRHRKKVFVDRFGWDVLVTDGDLEIDQFDNEAAVYLLSVDETGAVTGSVRLLPSLGPHLLGDLFPYLCKGAVPRGPDIWELSRFCTDPDLADPRLARKQLLVGVAEYALLNGIGRYTCVSHTLGLKLLYGIGWDARPLGPLLPDGGTAIGAMAIEITPGTLVLLRRDAGFQEPVLRIGARHAA